MIQRFPMARRNGTPWKGFILLTNMSGRNNRKLMPVGTSAGLTRCPAGTSGLGSCSRTRSPQRPLAKDVGGGGGHLVVGLEPGYRLRDCSVTLTRLHGVRVGDRVPSGESAVHGPLGRTSSAVEPPDTEELVVAPRGGPAQAITTANAARDGDTGVVVLLPLQDFTCALCGVSASAVAWVGRHFKSCHAKVLVRYSCRLCGKTSHSRHSIACHVPKCGGPRVAAPAGAVRCEGCEASFATERARSIHELHVHPDIRNRKRIQEGRKRGNSASQQTAGEAGARTALGTNRDSSPDGGGPAKRLRSLATRDSENPSEPVASSSLPPNQPNLPEGGLLTLLREEARKMVGEVGDDGTDYSHVLKAWLDGCDQLPELVEAATQRMLQGCVPG